MWKYILSRRLGAPNKWTVEFPPTLRSVESGFKFKFGFPRLCATKNFRDRICSKSKITLLCRSNRWTHAHGPASRNKLHCSFTELPSGVFEWSGLVYESTGSSKKPLCSLYLWWAYFPNPYESSIIWTPSLHPTRMQWGSRFRRSPIKSFRSPLQLARFFVYQTLR